jgi:hypothetical protein
MNFLKKLSGKTSPTKPKESAPTQETILCSNCGQKLKFLGNHGEGDPNFDYWHGNVCISCRKVFCPKCIATDGPTPCPQCGSPTPPAHRRYLEVIYGSPELNEIFKPSMPSVDLLPDIDEYFAKTREALEVQNLREFAQQAGLASLIAEESKDINLEQGNAK